MNGHISVSTLKYFVLACCLYLGTATNLQAQKVLYADPDREEPRQTNFEIIGKYGSNFLVYKNFRSNNYISVYKQDMKLQEKVEMSYMPDKVIEANFVAYPEHSYLFYQYQKKGVVYMMAVKLGANGKNLTEPIQIDTTITGGGGGNDAKIYSVQPSEDKSKILVFRINTKSERNFIFKTLLFDKDLTLLHATPELALDMKDRNDFLTDFNIDNEGNLVFGKGIRQGNLENISKFFLMVKPANTNKFEPFELKFDNITLDEVKLKVDNFNNRYLFTGFYYAGRRGTIEGIANAVYDKKQQEWVVRNAIPLDAQLREDARGTNSTKNAFNDYFIHDITIRSDGAFLINAESIYQESRGNNPYNRWDYLNPWMMTPMDYYRYSSMGYYGSPWGSPWGYGPSNATRYHTDNLMILAFNPEGKMILSNILPKIQFDDNSNNQLSYAMINSGKGLQYLYNDFDKRDVILTYQTLNPDGRLVRNPAIKNLDRNFDFLPRYAKQVGTKQVVVPCLTRGNLSFALIEFP